MFIRLTKAIVAPVVVGVIATGMTAGSVSAAEDEAAVYAFPDKYMLRLGGYIVDGADTTFSVNSDVGGLGTTIDYSRDLGGDSRDTIPRIDAYYRFNPRHRIDFTSFAIDRAGTRTVDINPPLVIGNETYSGETVNSEIKYNLYKLAYGYSFYHSPEVELTLTAGLNITSYELKFSDSTGNKVESADVTAPLPMFGLRMGYAINPKWSVNFVSEFFFIDVEDSLRGALINYELNTEYRLFKNFALGAGLARLSTDVEINDDDWAGRVTDSYRGYTVFGTFYF